MQADVTAVTIQHNKIVSNEVKDNYALLVPYYGENSKRIFWPIQYFYWIPLAWLIHGFASFCSNLTFFTRSLLATLFKSAASSHDILQFPSLIYFASRHLSPRTYYIILYIFYLLILFIVLLC